MRISGCNAYQLRRETPNRVPNMKKTVMMIMMMELRFGRHFMCSALHCSKFYAVEYLNKRLHFGYPSNLLLQQLHAILSDIMMPDQLKQQLHPHVSVHFVYHPPNSRCTIYTVERIIGLTSWLKINVAMDSLPSSTCSSIGCLNVVISVSFQFESRNQMEDLSHHLEKSTCLTFIYVPSLLN